MANDFLLLKYTHVGCVIVSYALFFVRGIWMMRESPLLQRRWVKVTPHVIDSALLLAAIGLTVMLRQYPLTHPWLTAKLIALLLYIGLGLVALTRGKTRRVRITAWVAAQLVFIYIVSVALTRNPIPLAAV